MSRTTLRVLYVTSHWPSVDRPNLAPFIPQQVNFLRKAGVDVTVMAYRGGANPMRYAAAIRQVRRHVASGKYDVVHARFGQAGFVAGMQRRVPVVVTFGGTDVLGRRDASGKLRAFGRMQRITSWLASRLATENVVVSEHLARTLRLDRYRVIPGGVDLDLFRPIARKEARDRIGLDPDKLIVLFPGALKKSWPHKRYELASEAVELVRDDFPSVELLVVNDRPHEEVPLFMSAGDVLLVTSWLEGSPNVVKEALACNLPVVSVPVGDVPERIAGIDGCVLCDDNRPATVARGLAQVLAKRERIDGRSSVAGLAEAMMAERTISVYESAINGS